VFMSYSMQHRVIGMHHQRPSTVSHHSRHQLISPDRCALSQVEVWDTGSHRQLASLRMKDMVHMVLTCLPGMLSRSLYAAPSLLIVHRWRCGTRAHTGSSPPCGGRT
jgi:hypothetical protein